MRVSVGHSNDPLSRVAMEEVLSQAREGLGGVAPFAGVLFTALDVDHLGVLAAIQEAYPGLPVVGCTSDGELSSHLQFQEDSIALMLFASASVVAASGLGQDLSADPAAACQAAVAEAMRDGDAPSLCLAFPESLTASAVSVVQALQAALPEGTLLVGGTSADQWNFEQTHQFRDGEVQSDAVAVLLFYGPLELGVGVASGWRPLGDPGTVTRSESNVVYEIDHQPAVTFYRRYFGVEAEFTPEYPLDVVDPASSLSYLRAPLAIEGDGSITFAGDVPEGCTVRISSAARDAIVEACRRSVSDAVESGGIEQATGALVISCAARKQVLGTRTYEEFDVLREALGDVPIVGFYSYGEIAPLDGAPIARLHNETMVSIVFGRPPR